MGIQVCSDLSVTFCAAQKYNIIFCVVLCAVQCIHGVENERKATATTNISFELGRSFSERTNNDNFKRNFESVKVVLWVTVSTTQSLFNPYIVLL